MPGSYERNGEDHVADLDAILAGSDGRENFIEDGKVPVGRLRQRRCGAHAEDGKTQDQ